MSQDPSTLVATASRTSLVRVAVETLAGTVSLVELVAALELAVASAETHAAATLAYAIAAVDGRIPSSIVVGLLPELDDVEDFLPIARLVEGDPVDVLLDAVETERLSREREGIALYVAARSFAESEGENEIPRRLIRRLRTFLRESMSGPASILAALAAALVHDAEVQRLAGDWLVCATFPPSRQLGDGLWHVFRRHPLDALADEDQGRLVTGYTVVRTQPKVGRNEPCPCGSGKKYKKCCEGKSEEPPPPKSHIDLFRESKKRERDARFDDLRPGELEKLDPAELTPLELVHALRKFTAHHRWESAERFVEHFATRPDTEEFDPEAHRLEVIELALQGGALATAERQLARLPEDDPERPWVALRLAMAHKAPDAIEQLEAVLREAHRNDATRVIEAAYAIIRNWPAIGILAARGAISGDRLLDSEMLLDEVGRARDRLDLPADDPFFELFDLLLEVRSREEEHRTGAAESERLSAELDTLRKDLRRASDRMCRLDEDLGKRERQLATVNEERDRLQKLIASRTGTSGGMDVEKLEEERLRLRSKIDELKGEISEGTQQRAELRRELARTADSSRATSLETAPRSGHDDDNDVDDDDAEEGEPASGSTRRLLLPEYSAAVSRALTSVPNRVAADALVECARLAGGDADAWAHAKHMRRAPHILSIRIGRAWRLLFRVNQKRLEVLELVHRRELQQAIVRLMAAM